VLSLIESYRESHDTIVIESQTNRKDEPVNPEDIEKIVEGVTAALTTALDGLKEALTPAVAAVEPGEDATVVDRAEVVEAAVEAGLPKILRARVVKAVEDGASIEEAIAAEKSVIDALKEGAVEDEPPAGKIREGKTTDNDYTVGGW
jgi:delta 1-pyrroline-5-carboxylate dehydrogenase